MFAILEGETPSKKVSARITLGDLRATYVATKTREIINIYKDEDLKGSIYISLRMIRELGVQSDSVDVYGEWEEFQWLIDGENWPKEVEIEWDEKAIGSANRVKGIEYLKLDDVSTVSSLTADYGQKVEDILYKNIPIERLKEENDLSWAEGKDYRILTEDDEIYEFIEGLDKVDTVVGFDTETTGLHVDKAKHDRLVGIVMSYKDDSGVYFPLLHERFENVKMGQEKLLELLKPYCDRHSPKAKDLVTHNGGFDWRVMKMHGWDLNIVHDTFIKQAIRRVSVAKGVAGLKGIVKHIFGYDVVELDDMYENVTPGVIKEMRSAVERGVITVNNITKRKLLVAEKKNDLLDFRFASREFVELYGPADGDFPRMVLKEMEKDWDHVLDFIYKLEVELIPVLGEQEYYGVRAIREGFEKLGEEARKRLKKLESAIYKEAGTIFNINSHQQKADVLFNRLGLPKKDKYKTKTGNWGTGKDVLKDLGRYRGEDGEPRYPIVGMLREQSKVSKLLDSFYEKLPEMIRDGSIFSSYNQAGAETGRLSSRQPNLQQTESTSRLYMVPDTDEHYFLICDYSQVEYRIMAGLANEKKVVDFFTKDPEADYHILAYANMVGKPYEDVTPEERDTGKVLNFGTTYGLEDASLAMNLYGNDSLFAQKKANQARKEYFEGIPDIRDYFESIRDKAEVEGYAETLFKRRRYIPEFQGDMTRISDYRRGSGRRKAGNHPVQGTAADIMKMAMIRVYNAFKKEGWTEDQARLVMNIHDELVVQIHKSINKWYALKLVREAMEMDLSKHGIPPLYIGANLGYSWADGKDALEAPVYLMNEKIAEIDELLEKGVELPASEDPRAEWIEEIDTFKMRVIKEEWARGYDDAESGEVLPIKDFLDAMKNPRLVRYSRHFGNMSERVVFEVVERGEQEVYKDIENVKAFKTEICKKILMEVEQEIKEGSIKKYSDVLRRKGLLSKLSYFGQYKWNVFNLVRELGAGEVYRTIGDKINNGELTPIKYEERPVKKGEDITEDLETVKDYVRKELVRYDKRRDSIIVTLEHDDMEIMELFERMLVPVTSVNAFKEGEPYVSFIWKMENGEEFVVGGYILFRKFIPTLGRLLVNHVLGVGYKGFVEEIEEVGGTMVKGV